MRDYKDIVAELRELRPKTQRKHGKLSTDFATACKQKADYARKQRQLLKELEGCNA